MLESELQLRKQLASMLPMKKEGSSESEKPIEGLNLARHSFMVGYHSSLKAERVDIPFLFQNTSPNQFGFMLEGAGMALTLLDEMNNSEKRYLPTLFSGRPTSELKLCAIGVGWASARLSKPIEWRPKGISIKWIPAISNGYGFHEGIFNPERFSSNSFFYVDEEFQEYFDIGLGRALWFNLEGQVEPIAEIINNLKPSRQGSMWKGIGVACAFNGSNEKKSILQKISSPYESYLVLGFEMADNLKQGLITSTQSNKY